MFQCVSKSILLQVSPPVPPSVRLYPSSIAFNSLIQNLSLSSSSFAELTLHQQAFWQDFQSYVQKMGPDLMAALPRPVENQKMLTIPPSEMRFRIDLWSDRGGYQITPHTDAPHKLATFLLYCSSDPSLHAEGTSVFRPLEPGFKCWAGKQWPFDQFEEVYRAPYAANSMFGFRKTDCSFHGKLPVSDSVSYRRTIAITVQTKENFIG